MKLELKKERIKWEKEKMVEVKIFKEKFLKKRGLFLFKKLVEMKRDKEKMVVRYRIMELKHKVSDKWKIFAENRLEEEFQTMRIYYETRLVHKCLLKWKERNRRIEIMTKQADRLAKKNLKKNCLIAWRDFNENCQIRNFRNQGLCKDLFDRVLLKRVLAGWKRVKIEQQEQIKKQERIEHLCKKVSEILPDFSY